MAKILKIENVSKAYQIGQFGTGTLSNDLNRWIALKLGKKDPYLKIGEENINRKFIKNNNIWSLRDINFDVEAGSAVGIVGKNGAGKSTLLKILSKITTPTKGQIKARGRISSLLEVGTGFHPELTGRENIFLNGAILGMRKHEIKRKFDEIVDFSGVERFVDTPVKRYSSGMYVRLAFAVAAHLESEILIVDEVLAVGDADFQKKCIGKMQDISNSQGRTILFVSHNMSAINRLCNSVVLLESGKLIFHGNTIEGVNKYLLDGTGLNSNINRKEIGNKKLFFRNYFLSNQIGDQKSSFTNEEQTYLNIYLIVNEQMRNCAISYELLNSEGVVIFASVISDSNNELLFWNKGEYEVVTEIPIKLLIGGNYSIQLRSAIPNVEGIDEPDEKITFEIIDLISPIALSGEGRRGLLILENLVWNRNKL
jgi:lipopolysaccharide transport system ATP-binding protein